MRSVSDFSNVDLPTARGNNTGVKREEGRSNRLVPKNGASNWWQKLRQHRPHIAKYIFWWQPSAHLFCYNINIISIRGQCPHCHRHLAATTCSRHHPSFTAHTALWQQCPVAAPKFLRCRQPSFDNSTLHPHPVAAPASQFQSAHGTQQRHPATAATHTTLTAAPEAAPCSGTLHRGTSKPAPKRAHHSDTSCCPAAAPCSGPAPKRTQRSNSSTLKLHPAAAPCSGTSRPPPKHTHRSNSSTREQQPARKRTHTH